MCAVGREGEWNRTRPECWASRLAGPNAKTLLFNRMTNRCYYLQVGLLKDTIRRNLQEVAEEISASAATESLGMTTELAKRDARITQLGSRIEDLQVQQCT